MPTTNSVFPEGHVHWFYRCFNWLCGKPVKLDGVKDEYHTVICNCAVYTTDGRYFYGYYTPDSLEDLDPFAVVPPDFFFCCQCCCYQCCECYREKYDAECKRESDLFFGKGKEEDDKEPVEFIPEPEKEYEAEPTKVGQKTRRNRKAQKL
jgi:hypothetical protein